VRRPIALSSDQTRKGKEREGELGKSRSPENPSQSSRPSISNRNVDCKLTLSDSSLDHSTLLYLQLDDSGFDRVFDDHSLDDYWTMLTDSVDTIHS